MTPLELPESDHQHTRTERLALDAVTDADLEAIYALHSDAEVWRHLPSGRHVDRTLSRAFISEAGTAWSRDGLGYWAARIADGAARQIGIPAQTFIGVGGCQRRFDSVWNIYYRLSPGAWGHGFAGEIVAAARSAAAQVDVRLPVVAYLLEHNVASRRTAERAGLTLAWSGPDHGNPDPTAIRLLYSDRPLTKDLITELTSRD